MNIKKLIQSGFIYTLGNIFIQGLTFITLPIYTRTLTVEVYGQYSLYTAWVGLFALFIGLQTNGSLSSAKVTYKERFDDYAVSAFTVGNVVCLGVLFVVFTLQEQLALWIGFSPTILFLLVIHSYVTYVVTFLGQYFIQYQKSVANLILSFFNAVTSVILSLTLIFHWEDDLMARIVGASAPLICSAIVAWIYLYRRSSKWFQRHYLPFIVSVSVPLIFHLLGHHLLNHLDRMMIASYFNTEQVALYSFGYSLGMIIQIVLMSLNTAWVPWFFEARRKKMAGLPNVIRQYLWLGVFLTLGYLTIYPEIAHLMGDAKYSASISFIAIIIVGYFFVYLYTFPVNIQFFYANTKWIPVGTLGTAAINFCLNLWFIPHFGPLGAAFTTAFSYACLLVLHHVVTKRLYQYRDVLPRQYVCLASTVIGYALLMSWLAEQLVWRWLGGLIVVGLYYLRYQKQIKQWLHKRKRRMD